MADSTDLNIKTRPAVLGFYAMQALQIRCWDAKRDSVTGPLFTAAEMNAVIEEAYRRGHIISDITAITSGGRAFETKDQLFPDYTETEKDATTSPDAP